MNFFEDDIDPLTLPSEPSIISSICKDGNLAHFDDVLSILIALSTNVIVQGKLEKTRKLSLLGTARKNKSTFLYLIRKLLTLFIFFFFRKILYSSRAY